MHTRVMHRYRQARARAGAGACTHAYSLRYFRTVSATACVSAAEPDRQQYT